MDFELCEIRAIKHEVFLFGLSFYCKWEFIAEAMGPDGTYITARTQKFSPSEYYRYDLLDKPFERDVLNGLVNHLIRVGWELLPQSGVNWYSRRFQRPIALYMPDPDLSTPYTIGDGTKWQQKALRALNKYERRRDAESSRNLGKTLMGLGLALEREHQFQDACTAYNRAAQYFENISAADEAAKAKQHAARVLGFHLP